MNSKNPEQEPLAPEPRPDAKSSGENSWSREDAIIHALLKGDETLYKDLGGERTETPQRRDAVSGKNIVPQAAKPKFSDQEDYGDVQEEGYLPDLNAAERHPNFYRNVLKNSFDELLFRVLEREYPQMKISVQESTFPKVDPGSSNFLEVRLGSGLHRAFLDNLLRRQNVVLYLLEEACKAFTAKQYERLAETLEKEKKLPEGFAKRLIARAYAERLKNPVTASDPFHSERIKAELRGLPDPVSNEEIAEIIRTEVDLELKKPSK